MDKELIEELDTITEGFLSQIFDAVSKKRQDTSYFNQALKHRERVVREDIEKRKPLPVLDPL